MAGVPHTPSPAVVVSFRAPIFSERNFTIFGVTKDINGAALGACTVKLYRTIDDVREQTTVSDAQGNYSFNVDKTKTYYCVAVKAATAGTTLNTLAGA